ncbi:MAG: alpha/beta fold hydrolase, partial [Rhodanobacteraceae bacterium]
MPNTHLLIGNGPHKVIALHGWYGHARGWGSFAQNLDGTQFSYAFMDCRGYGGMRGSGGPYTMEQVAN